MRVKNNCTFAVKAIAWYDNYGGGEEALIQPGEENEVEGPYVGEIDGGSCTIFLRGNLTVHEGDDGDANQTFKVAANEPLHLADKERKSGILVCHADENIYNHIGG